MKIEMLETFTRFLTRKTRVILSGLKKNRVS